MTENFIQLKKPNIVKLAIQDFEGNETGEYLEFDVENTKLPIVYQEMIEKEKRNRQNFNNQINIIEKRQDIKGKKLLSKNEEDKIRALDDFINKELETFDMFLGDNGSKKLLNGRQASWYSMIEILEIIQEQIFPYLEKSMKTTDEKLEEIKKKYSQENDKVLRDE